MSRVFPIAGIPAFLLFPLAGTSVLPVVIAAAAVVIIIAGLVFTLLLRGITIRIQLGKGKGIWFERLPRKRDR